MRDVDEGFGKVLGNLGRGGRAMAAVGTTEAVVPASALAEVHRQVRDLQQLLRDKTREAEILKEALAAELARKWISRTGLGRNPEIKPSNMP